MGTLACGFLSSDVVTPFLGCCVPRGETRTLVGRGGAVGRSGLGPLVLRSGEPGLGAGPPPSLQLRVYVWGGGERTHRQLGRVPGVCMRACMFKATGPRGPGDSRREGPRCWRAVCVLQAAFCHGILCPPHPRPARSLGPLLGECPFRAFWGDPGRNVIRDPGARDSFPSPSCGKVNLLGCSTAIKKAPVPATHSCVEKPHR